MFCGRGHDLAPSYTHTFIFLILVLILWSCLSAPLAKTQIIWLGYRIWKPDNRAVLIRACRPANFLKNNNRAGTITREWSNHMKNQAVLSVSEVRSLCQSDKLTKEDCWWQGGDAASRKSEPCIQFEDLWTLLKDSGTNILMYCHGGAQEHVMYHRPYPRDVVDALCGAVWKTGTTCLILLSVPGGRTMDELGRGPFGMTIAV